MRRACLAVALVIGLGCGGDKTAKDAAPEKAPEKPVPKAEPTTSAPSEATVALLAKQSGVSITVLVEDDVFGDQIVGYANELASAAKREAPKIGNLIAEPTLAKRFRAGRGALAFSKGDRDEVVRVARHRLARLDEMALSALEKLSVERRTAVVSAPRSLEQIRDLLDALDVREKSYQPAQEIAPTDLLVVVGDGAEVSIGDAAISEHIAAGGSAFIAIEPGTKIDLSSIGVKLSRNPIADDKQFAIQTRTPADHKIVVTNDFADHPASGKRISKSPSQLTMAFPESGSLQSTKKDGVIVTALVKTSASAFDDKNRNGTADRGEKRAQRTIGAAVERGDARVVVYADTSWLDDQVLRAVVGGQMLAGGAITWLLRRDTFVTTKPTDTKLKGYPARARPKLATAPWTLTADVISSIAYRDPRGIRKIRRSNGAWLAVVEVGGKRREYDLRAKEADELARAWATPAVVDHVGEASAADFGIDGMTTVIVTADREYKLDVGSNVFGRGERYVRFERTIFTIDNTSFSSLQHPARIKTR